MSKPSWLVNRKGAVKFKVLIWAAVLFLAFYAGYKLLLPYFSYYMLKTDVEEEAKLAHMYTDETMRRRIVSKARAWNVPITVEDVVIYREFRKITIKIHYSETIVFFGRYKRRLDFRIEAKEPLKESSGILR